MGARFDCAPPAHSPLPSLPLSLSPSDGYIDICDATRGYKRIRRCAGHTSGVTALDWSVDGTVLQSNDASSEIIWWSADTGRQICSSADTVEADTAWHTWTCCLGFQGPGGRACVVGEVPYARVGAA